MSGYSPANENRLAQMARQAPKRENRLAQMATDVAGSGFMRGLTALPYRLLGAPVDLADMVVRPIANAAGIPIAEPQNMYGTSDWMMKQAMDAGLLMPRTDTGAEMAGDFLGQLAAPGVGPAEAGTMKAIFAGPLALTADRDALARATARLDAGDDPAKVWAEEGWFRGPDGKMRFEIDDSASMFRGTGAADSAYAAQAIHHPELYSAYPEAGSVFVQRTPGYDASYSGQLDEPYGAGRMEIGYEMGPKTHSAAIHEMQHAVQGREGFARGGAPNEFDQQSDAEFARDVISWRNELLRAAQSNPDKTPNALSRIVEAEYRGLGAPDFVPPERVRQYAEMDTIMRPEMYQGNDDLSQLQELVSIYGLNKAVTPRTPIEAYRRLAGEAEARATEARLRLTAEQRRARYPLQDYDVPLDELIVR